MSVLRDTQAMIAGMRPGLRPGAWVFRSFATAAEAAPHLDRALGSFREDEGLSLILPDSGTAADAMRCITLHVQSALDGIGLTHAVAEVLTRAGIPCNMVAAHHHDHVFVPADKAETALELLLARSRAAQAAADDVDGDPGT